MRPFAGLWLPDGGGWAYKAAMQLCCQWNSSVHTELSMTIQNSGCTSMQDLADRLCASWAAAGPTLLAAFEEPGSEEANIAAAAAAQTCGSGGNRLGSYYMHAGNPDDDYSDGSRAAE